MARARPSRLINSTISGNVARDIGPNSALGGGIYVGNGNTLTLSNVTVAGNEARGRRRGRVPPTAPSTTLANTIVADNTGGACAGDVAAIRASSHHNLVTDGSCALTGPGNLQGVAAQIGGLANNGGPTDTRALAATSPAVNAGSGCTATDQRGIARPQGAACDIGAFEYVAPTLTVTTTVTNNDGGEDRPADFSVRVDLGRRRRRRQPAAGQRERHDVHAGARARSTSRPNGSDLYTLTLGGACAADGDGHAGREPGRHLHGHRERQAAAWPAGPSA